MYACFYLVGSVGQATLIKQIKKPYHHKEHQSSQDNIHSPKNNNIK